MNFSQTTSTQTCYATIAVQYGQRSFNTISIIFGGSLQFLICWHSMLRLQCIKPSKGPSFCLFFALFSFASQIALVAATSTSVPISILLNIGTDSKLCRSTQCSHSVRKTAIFPTSVYIVLWWTIFKNLRPQYRVAKFRENFLGVRYHSKV